MGSSSMNDVDELTLIIVSTCSAVSLWWSFGGSRGDTDLLTAISPPALRRWKTPVLVLSPYEEVFRASSTSIESAGAERLDVEIGYKRPMRVEGANKGRSALTPILCSGRDRWSQHPPWSSPLLFVLVVDG